jgi:hypothetical protein
MIMWGLLWLGEIEIVGPESFVVTFQRPSVDVGMVYTCIYNMFEPA